MTDITDYRALAADAYDYAVANYDKRDARYDVIVECWGKDEIAAAFEEQGVTDYAAGRKWADELAGLSHEQELNQAWDGPESCIGSSKYDPQYDPRY